jgi:hypothetical protein
MKNQECFPPQSEGPFIEALRVLTVYMEFVVALFRLIQTFSL